MVSILFQTWRWQIMLKKQTAVSFNATLKLYIINRLTNLLFLFRAGEGVRILAASKQFRISVPYLLATFINERILNAVFLAMIALGLTFAVPFLEKYQIHLIAGLIFVAAAIGWFALRRSHEINNNLRSQAHQESQSRIQKLWRNFLSGLTILRDPSILFGTVLSSIGSWCCLWFGIFCLAQNVQPSNPFVGALAVLLCIHILSLLPLTPSSVGPFQWGCIFAFSYFGVNQTDAVAFSLLLQGVRIIAAILTGMGALAFDYFRPSLGNIRQRLVEF